MVPSTTSGSHDRAKLAGNWRSKPSADSAGGNRVDTSVSQNLYVDQTSGWGDTDDEDELAGVGQRKWAKLSTRDNITTSASKTTSLFKPVSDPKPTDEPKRPRSWNAHLAEIRSDDLRTVQLVGLPIGTTHQDIIDTVRGGMLLDVFMLSHSSYANLTFVYASDARSFLDHAQRHGLYIKSKKVRDTRRSMTFRRFALLTYIHNI